MPLRCLLAALSLGILACTGCAPQVVYGTPPTPPPPPAPVDYATPPPPGPYYYPPPPPVPYEVAPPPPFVGAVWVGGYYYHWHGRWRWHHGYYHH